MKHKKMFKINNKWVVFGAAILVVFGLVLWILTVDSEFKNNTHEQKEKSTNQKNVFEKTSKKQSVKSISFSAYSHLYNSEIGAIEAWECEYDRALLEFVFLERGDNEEIRPHENIPAIVVKKSKNLLDKKLEKKKCPYQYPASNGNRPYIYFLNIAKHCLDCNENALLPGEMYKIIRIGEHENLDYKFRVPPEDELVFKKEFSRDQIEGTKDDPVHRIPVLIGDALETQETSESKELPLKPIPEKTLTVKGVPELADSERLLVHYMLEGGKERDAEKVGDGTWEVTLKQRGLDTTVGGSLVMYRITPSKRARSGLAGRLIGYVPEVTKNPVRLSSSGYKNFEQKKWHKRRIKLNSILPEDKLEKLNKLEPEKVKRRKAVLLTVKNTEVENEVHACVSKVSVEEGDYYTTLKAPRGTYKLKFEETVIEPSFHWPPNDE